MGLPGNEAVGLTDNVQIVNAKGEMKGSAITGPVGKEAAELWPVSLIKRLQMQGYGLTRRSVLPATLVSSCEVFSFQLFSTFMGSGNGEMHYGATARG